LLGNDTVLLGSALVVLAVLFVWWGVFARRLIVEAKTLAVQLEPDRAVMIADRADRQQWMIAGEGVLFFGCLLTCCLGLFMVAQRRRHHAEQLQSAMQMATHELKTPIASVRALLQSLQLGSVPAPRVAGLLQQGLRECGRLERLSESLLAHQRAVTIGLQTRVHMDVAAFVNELLNQRRAAAMDEHVTVDIVDHSPSILSDPDALRVIMENLLDNAGKYGGGKPVTVRIAGGAEPRIDVTDAGVGFPSDQCEALFEPFARAHPGATRGSGLGLSIARTLMRQLGGDLQARSDGHDRGAVFTVALPKNGSVAASPVQSVTSPRAQSAA
jgi:signal transduction histidine kinase